MNGMAITTNMTGDTNPFIGGEISNYPFYIFDTENNLLAPIGQLWPTTFYTPTDPVINEQWLYNDLGDLFGIAIDNEKNVYFSASSTVDITPEVGTAGSAGIYRLNAEDWSISEFITTGDGANQIQNFGSGLGNICFDKWHNQLFITNFEDGKIYRFDMDGNFLSTFDPFEQDDLIEGFVGVNEAVWGINIYGTDANNTKVYFSRWADENINTSVWSIDLDANGEFIGNESFCFFIQNPFDQIIANITVSPISDITFSSQGIMYVCEKTIGVNTNSFSPSAHRSQVFEYSFVGNQWNQTNAYFIGNNEPGRNAAGGVALSNRETKEGIECDGLVWATADAMITSPEYFYGAAGVPTSGNTYNLFNLSATNSIYVDIDIFDNGKGGSGFEKKYRYGDIEIYNDGSTSSSFKITPTTTICEGQSVQLNVTGGSNYEWSPALTLDDINSANPTATPTENTTYTVTGEGGECGGGGTASVTINIDDFNFSLASDIVNCVTAEGQTLDAGEEAQSYLWNTGETTQTIIATTTGDYTVNVVSPAGCDYSDEISLINSQAPTLAFSTPNNGSCPPATFTLNDESIPIESDPIVAWNWQVDDNNYINSTTSIGLQNSGSYAVTLEVTTELGCVETLTIDNYLNVFSAPTPEFITEPAELSKCDKTIELINLSADYDSLSWNFGDGITINEDTVSTYTYSEVSDYTIALTTVNSLGCEKTFNKQITPEISIPFFAPNAFTPDKDDLNEVFMPILGCHENFEFWVFNRWGENIFYSNDINKGWDGTYKDQLSPIGIYSWKARYDGTKDNQVKFGEVHLMH